MRVTVIGLGYVGLTTAAVLSRLGHQVLGVEMDRAKLQRIKRGDPVIQEPELEDLLREGLAQGNLQFAHLDDVTMEQRDVVMVAVGTPSMPDGSCDVSYVQSALRWAVAKSAGGTVITMKSSLPPGTGRRLQESELSDTMCHYVANPEFLQQGSAVRDSLQPTRLVIGGEDEQAIDAVAQMYAGIESPMICTDITSAEMIKYAANAFLVTKISFINDIAWLCRNVGGHIDDVTQGISLDPRIGSSFLRSGIGWGGSCFPKDVAALDHVANNNGGEIKLLQAVMFTNDRQKLLPLMALQQRFGDLKGLRVAALGLTFKPGTDDMRDAPSRSLIAALVEAGAEVKAYDPVANELARTLLPEEVDVLDSPEEALTGAAAAVLITEWPELVNLPWNRVATWMDAPMFVFDGRNVLDIQKMLDLGFEYEAVGRAVKAA
ncbi:MAG: UDP-glucose dehydrogenase family protein [Dehalococcoidia bacterium]